MEGEVGLVTEALVVDGIGAINTVLIGAEGGYTLGVNSGFNPEFKPKGILSEYIK